MMEYGMKHYAVDSLQPLIYFTPQPNSTDRGKNRLKVHVHMTIKHQCHSILLLILLIYLISDNHPVVAKQWIMSTCSVELSKVRLCCICAYAMKFL